MKKNLFKTLILVLFALLSISFIFNNTIKVNALQASLTPGEEVSISNINGNLNNVNIRFEFSTNVNLDGTNNALLVALLSSDGTVLTDTRFIVQSTNSGLYDEDDVALIFENVPLTIGTKSNKNGLYTYSFESRDFSIVNESKNISKLVIIASKGAQISSEVLINEVKYSVKFGDNASTLYSYNSLITAPSSISYTYDIDGHSGIDEWIGDDSSVFVDGSTYATKDIEYTGQLGIKENHTWTNVNEVEATRGVNGIKAHQVCSICGAKRIDSTSTSLASDEDLILVHTCSYEATFDWSNANNPGDKPKVTYNCTNHSCNYSHILTASEITMNEKTGSRVNASCTSNGSVIYVANASYEGHNESAENGYILPKTGHTLIHHNAIQETCTNDGNIEYYECSICHKKFSDSEGINEITNIIVPAHHTILKVNSKEATCTTDGNIEHWYCPNCNKYFSNADATTEITDLSTIVIPASHTLTHHDAAPGTDCQTAGTVEYWECLVCNKKYSDANATTEINSIEGAYGPHTITKVDAVDATCIEAGNIEHYKCTICNKTFSDSEGINEITDVTITTQHSLVHHDGVEPTCTRDGIIEYWECELCHKLFSDSNGEKEVTSIVAPMSHKLTHFDAVESTCTTMGNIEYYHCSICDKNFDKNGNEIENPFIPFAHTPIKHNPIKATCTTDGSIEYYECSECHKFFSDEACTNEITDVLVKATGHKFGSNGRCEVCGKTDPNYKPSSGCRSTIAPFGVGIVLLSSLFVLRRKKKHL